MSESEKDRKEVADVLVIDFRRLKNGASEGLTALINMTRTPPQIPISLPNINSLIKAAVQNGLQFCIEHVPPPNPSTPHTNTKRLDSLSLLCVCHCLSYYVSHMLADGGDIPEVIIIKSLIMYHAKTFIKINSDMVLN